MNNLNYEFEMVGRQNMNKIRVIDLLNKIVNGEEVPNKIKMNGIVFEYQGDDYLYIDEDKEEHWLFSVGYTTRFMWLDTFLNANIEIIEQPKKLKKITWSEKESLAGTPKQSELNEIFARRTEKLKKSLNQIIDKLGDSNE